MGFHKRYYLTGIITLMILILTSCTYRLTSLPKLNIAGPGVSGSTLKISDYKIAENKAKGEDSYSIIIFIPLLGNNQKLTEGMINNAIDKICKEKNYKFMTNVKIYTSGYYIPFIYGKVTVIIEGEGWVDKQTSSLYNFNLWNDYDSHFFSYNWESK
jgi:hypothetical protein